MRTKLLFISIFLLLLSCNQITTKKGFITEKKANNRIDDIIGQIEEPQIPSDTINLIEFSGHEPDTEGTIDFHGYIQDAIDSLSARGGGWLRFANTGGTNDWIKYTQTYRIEGYIDIKSNVGLLIDKSIRLFFPFAPEKYLNDGEGVLTRYEGTTIHSFAPLIRSFNAENIAIKAHGQTGAIPLIDGDGEKWQRWMWEGEANRSERGLKPSYQKLKDINNQDVPIAERVYTDPESHYFRPQTMEFFLTKNVLVEGIKITRSPFWCIKPVFSESCTFRNIYFDAMVVNNDGIDPSSSKNILIENITFGNHDDNVALKAGRDKEGRDGAIVANTDLENIDSEYINDGRIGGSTENVVIRNCAFSGHYAICIGSEMSGGVREVYAVDNFSIGSVNMGVFLKSSRLRGGTIENIYVNGLHLNESRSGVVALVPNYDKADEANFPPTFRNIQIENVSCQNSEAGIRIFGWKDEPIRNVYLKSFELHNVKKDLLEINNSENIILEDVIINGKKEDKVIEEKYKDGKPPTMI